MEWIKIGSWAADKGPLLAVIAGQWVIIWRLLARFFEQQAIIMKQLQTNSRAVELTQQVVSSRAEP